MVENNTSATNVKLSMPRHERTASASCATTVASSSSSSGAAAEDPLSSLRAQLPQHEVKARALLSSLQEIGNYVGKLDEAQQKTARLFRTELMAPSGRPVNHDYSQACTLFVNQLNAIHESILDAQCELAGAVCFAEEMVDRNHEIQGRLLQRDRTNGQLKRCIIKVQELSQKDTKHMSRDYDQQIGEALDKYHNVEREAETLDKSVAADLKALIEHQDTDYARVLAPFSRYLGVAASTEANTAYILAKKVPNMLRSAVHEDLVSDQRPQAFSVDDDDDGDEAEEVSAAGGTIDARVEETPRASCEGTVPAGSQSEPPKETARPAAQDHKA